MNFGGPNPLKQLLSTAKAALENDDGKEFADLMSLNHPFSLRNWNLNNINLDPPFDQMMLEHFQCSDAVIANDFATAFNHQCNVIQIFARMFKTQKEDNWGLPMMNIMIKDMFSLAVKADIVAVANGEMVGSKIDACADMLMTVFRVCASDSRTSIEYTKRWGLMPIINLLFKCYFKTNKLHLCKPLIIAIETNAANKDIKDLFSIADRVTYNYFVGMKHMFENEFKGADKCLSFSFENCLKSCTSNKRKILICLIPVKMTLGFMPKVSILKKYNLCEFEDVVEAVKTGNIKLLNEAIEKNAAFFTRAGIYLILEKLKVITLRNLFKKIYLITGSFQIDVARFKTALNWLGLEDVDSDETECILANMINDGYIKGYISEQHKKIVVSKVNAFPKLNTFL
ncbi:PCI domain-containing protein 2-like [Bolinopsis microptera]|uniref:PCI domain-containing protein 2-like n=1 Tax=Bolinopsis microptera TaxID=2820187 RepID=UPI00307981C4